MHISAPSRGADDRRYKQHLQGVFTFDAVRKHDILSYDHPPSPRTTGKQQTRTSAFQIPSCPINEAPRSVKPGNGEASKEHLSGGMTKKRKVDDRKPGLLRVGKSIASILQEINHNAPLPVVQVKRTPAPSKSCVQVKRTPVHMAKSTFSTNIHEHFYKVRKWQHGRYGISGETPPSEIPDSQPLQGSEYVKVSSPGILPYSPRSKQYETQMVPSSQLSDRSHNSEEHSDNLAEHGSTASQQHEGSLAEGWQSRDAHFTAPRLDLRLSAEYEPVMTSSQSRDGDRHPDWETYEEFLHGKSPNPRSPSPPSAARSSPNHSEAGSLHLPPLGTMVHYDPKPLPSRLRPPFTTHLTPYLRDITSPTGAYPLSTIFTAKILSRCPGFRQTGMWQRGIWHIPMTSWPEAAQIKFWEHLKTKIQAGDAGYAGAVNAWIKAGDDPWEGPNTEKPKGRGKDLLSLQVGCWVEVMGQVWCLLWEASDGKVGDLKGKATFLVDEREVVRMA